MRSSRFIALALAVVTVAGCARTGGPDIFARNAPPPWARSDGTDILSHNAPAPWARPARAQPVAAPAIASEPMPEIQPVAAAPRYVAPAYAAPAYAAPAPEAYTLDSGDKLRVVVFGQEGLSNSYTVDPSGSITMPLIGAVRARGMTTAGIQESISARLRQGYIREPHVAVEVEAYRPFFILGEVTLPGQYPYVANMTVETAVAIAGGYTPRAFKYRIEISHPVNGLTVREKVPPTYPVRPGDTIVISERWF